MNETEHEIDLDSYEGSKEGFSVWQQYLDPLYYQRPLEERVGIAIDLAMNWNGPDTLRLSLALGPLLSLAHSIANGWGVTLQTAVARAMGGVISRRQSYVDYDEMHLVGWGLLLKT